MFIAALFEMLRWKQSKCPSTGECTNCGITVQWNTTKQWKGMSYPHMSQNQ
jgi:hypothetical protein